jgi:3-phenylpropionate/trans-cinnamate dioxygenase ferredoxin reductase subunit
VPRIVVVGASLAGLRVAEAARAEGFRGEIIVIGDEPYLPYNRPPLSKEALAGGVEFGQLEFRRRASIDDVTWRLGVPVTAADLAARTVTLADGTAISYDGLAIATGLRPRRLSLPGPRRGRHVVRTLEDATGLRAALTARRPHATPTAGLHPMPTAGSAARPRVVVIGAGFVGCEVAATAQGMGCQVEIVAPEPEPLLRPLGALIGSAVRRRHERHGVRFHLGRLPSAFEPSPGDPDQVGAVLLDDGTRLAADVVVEALGCAPSTDWLRPGPVQDTAVDLADGVLTDGWMRVLAPGGAPVPGVVAAGDVARFPNPLFDAVPRRVEHWSIPTDTGKRAGATLAAVLDGRALDERPFTPMPSFWSDQYGERLQSFGVPGLADEIAVVDGDPDGAFIAAYRQAGRLVGVAGIGMMPGLLRLRGDLLASAAQPT